MSTPSFPSGADLRALSPLYGLTGPFATAYVETGDGAVGARWAALAELADGIDAADLATLRPAITRAPAQPYGRTRVVVARAGTVLLTSGIGTPVGPAIGDRLVSAPLPDLYTYVARQLEVVPNLVLLAGADTTTILRVTQTGHERLWPGDDDDSVDDEAAGDEAETPERAFARLAITESPDLVVVVGEPLACRRAVERVSQSRILPPDVVVRVVEADPSAPASVAAAVEAALREHVRPAVVQALRAATAKGAAVGPAAVVEALRMAEADTVVVSADAALPAQCWIGHRPTEFGLRDSDAARFGVSPTEPARFDAALVRAVAATAARLVVVPPDAGAVPGGVAAVLRY